MKRLPYWSSCLILLLACRSMAGNTAPDWFDAYYPVRFPVELDVAAPGRQVLDIDIETLTEAVNRKSPFKFRPEHFAYDQLKLVAVDDSGRQTPVDGAFFLKYENEIVRNGDFRDWKDGRPAGWTFSSKEGFALKKDDAGRNYLAVTGGDRHFCGQTVPVSVNSWYCFSYRVKGLYGIAPMAGWRNGSVQPVPHSYVDPYFSDREWLDKTFYFHTGDPVIDWKNERIDIRIERFDKDVADISLKKCSVAFVADLTAGGRKRYYLYYSPVEGTTCRPPAGIAAEFPARKLAVAYPAGPDWVDNRLIRYLGGSREFRTWSVPATRKVLEHEQLPLDNPAGKITLSSAGNETETLQIVLRPLTGGKIEQITLEFKDRGGRSLPPEAVGIGKVEYVDIRTPSTYIMAGTSRPARFDYTGRLPDPVVPAADIALVPGGPDIVLWIEVKAPSGAAAGSYSGALKIRTATGETSIPVEWTVWDFRLPDRPSCRTAFSFCQYANQFLFPFHKVTDEEDKYALSRAYVAAMAKYRLSDKGPTSAGVFKTGYARSRKTSADLIAVYKMELPWAMDELNLTGFIIGHYPGAGHMVKLTDEEAARRAEFYNPVAEYLLQNRWLDRAYIWIDEPRLEDYPGLYKFAAAMRKQPYAGKIKLFPLVYQAFAYDRLKDHVDILAVFDNEDASVVSPRGIGQWPDNKEIWFYYTRSALTWIDSPGLNQRYWAPKVWALGGKGIAIWAINQWWTYPNSPHISGNPWVDPHSTWGNGVLSFFYPPSRDGKELKEKDLSITPSLRLSLIRDGIEDFEYAEILSQLIIQADGKGMDTAAEKQVLQGFRRPFVSPRSWTLSETYWQETRRRMAQAIMSLNDRLK